MMWTSKLTVMGTATMGLIPTDYVDLHCHLLPGLDDGPQQLDQAIEMARQAVGDGIRYVLATPHHLDRHYQNTGPVVERAVIEFQAELQRQRIPLTVFAGQEVHLRDKLVATQSQLLGIDAGRRYLLLELPHEQVPHYTAQVVFELLQHGTTPVIAHPERNAQIMARPEQLYDLIQQGCLAQLTAGSIVGQFGRAVKSTALELVEYGLVQLIASDAHFMARRGFMMRAGYQALARLDGHNPAYFATNARLLLNGDPVALGEVLRPKQRRKFWLF
ncbi:tyrosine protein phosphatase [Lactiplantibacillus plantarum]|nr:tyrosine protein phosphatase [Lactiplantibacillus plantarum]MCG0861001.1 tyrosine protein phosphatase [Lactiplantibacillus plantarum]